MRRNMSSPVGVSIVAASGVLFALACASGGGGGTGGSDASTAVGATDGSATSPNDPSSSVINGCTSFVDQTADTAARKIDWSPSVSASPSRCMKVRVGQTVAFEGVSKYALAPAGGTTPTPFAAVADTGKVKLDAPGTYGFTCPTTPAMNGAIQAVP